MLLVDQWFAIDHDVDQENMRDLQRDFFLSLGGHQVRRVRLHRFDKPRLLFERRETPVVISRQVEQFFAFHEPPIFRPAT